MTSQKKYLDDLVPGKETDLLVAAALGMDIGTLLGSGKKFVRGVERNWSPSTNLDHAFEVADKVFSAFNVQKTSGAGFGFCTIEAWHGFNEKYPNGQILAATPQMAICKAIIESKNAPQD